jgi:hypothetical protein
MNASEVRSRNVRTVNEFYEAERRRDIEAWSKLWSEGGRQSFWVAGPVPPVIGRQALVAVTVRKFEVRPPYGLEVRTEAFEDPAKVLARLHLIVSDDVTVDLWCLFHFGDDGLITEVEEMLDTARGPVFPE